MTPHRAINIGISITLAIGIAAILSTGHHLDDNRDEWAASQAVDDAQRAARSAHLRERAAARLCTEAQGPGSGYRWTEAGDLVCHDHRTGRAAVVVAKGGAL